MDALGKRLRAGNVSDEDWELLEHVLDAHQRALDAVVEHVVQLGYAPTSRVKSTGTLIEKLKRGTSFKSVQDTAGARIVVDGDLAAQDTLVQDLVDDFDVDVTRHVKDRRRQPNHGYRAVHVIVINDGLPVEVQVRTSLQDLWAQMMERLADSWGRGIRYGEPLSSADVELIPGSVGQGIALTRGDLLDAIFQFGIVISRAEEREWDSAADTVALKESPLTISGVTSSARILADVVNLFVGEE